MKLEKDKIRKVRYRFITYYYYLLFKRKTVKFFVDIPIFGSTGFTDPLARKSVEDRNISWFLIATINPFLDFSRLEQSSLKYPSKAPVVHNPYF